MSHECYWCEEHADDMYYARDFYQGIVDMLYGNDELDIEKLTDYFDELGNYLDIQNPFKNYNTLPSLQKTVYFENKKAS